ncbi:MAG TPA: hypothetical protein VHY31_13895, partial [Streptosporangiaceae bacterium]|nr:hypothetical protein [Streptosporangiaceae bacterium]
MTRAPEHTGRERAARGEQAPDREQAGGEQAGKQGPGRKEWQILAVVLVGSFMAVLDTTIVNVALPSIGQGI